MKTTSPQTIHLKDYKQPTHWIDEVKLFFNLKDDVTEVTAETQFRPNPNNTSSTLTLQGEFFKLIRLELNGKLLEEDEYQIEEGKLTLTVPDEPFKLKAITHLKPEQNTALEGLYKSGDIYCTQCEAEGFRRITYFLDRPDVMATYTTTIEADQKKFPVLLSNGNCIQKEQLASGRHRVTWHDPFKKPCYLFAMVAGDLGKIEGEFTTKSGRKVTLQVFVDPGNESKAEFSLEALKRAMKWDEDRFGLEYDLDIFMIVAVNSFNAGAMENKGLNIFNSKYILANSETTTDDEYIAIEGVVGHEYFHNWTGNRVTCRDWFQLSLKEGLTVYRDQEFTADLHSRGVHRIADVQRLRTHQFSEDAGPMAHPVRPTSYMEINNFYTTTVYEKGAEVVRMIATLIGRDNFRRGIEKYFELYDGQAVTTEDFVHAMEIASGKDLSQFKLWYDQAGTPSITYKEDFDQAANIYTLTLNQTCPPTPGQPEKKPFHIPVKIGLLAQDGSEIAFKPEGPLLPESTNQVLELTETQQTFTFKNIPSKPTLSILREFSAPVHIQNERPFEELTFLMKYDTDDFSRWDAGQKVFSQWILDQYEKSRRGQPLEVPASITDAVGEILNNTNLDPQFKALMLQIPSFKYLSELLNELDPYALKRTRDYLITSIARSHQAKLHAIYNSYSGQGELLQGSGERSLKNITLYILTHLGDEESLALAQNQFQSPNMTLKYGALQALNLREGPAREEALLQFYKQFKDDPVTITKWLMINAAYEGSDWKVRYDEALRNPVFNPLVPNYCYSLLDSFAASNVTGFHHPEGIGYKLIADWVLSIDKSNPQVASRLVSKFNRWKKLEPVRRELMREQIERITKSDAISPNTFEIASKALQ
jgi:aminopeptidase N